MAPKDKQPREESIERTTEYEEFLDELAKYHEKPGTILDREPKVANRHIDLLRLYKRVISEGGYDKVSDTKGNKLAWRRLAGEFLPGSPHLTTQAFLIKSAYYKNLAAYEISTIHKREPPPKEILEDVSAKGGDLLTRTAENYFRPLSRETERLRNGDEDSEESDGEGESRTPRENKMDIDDPGSTGRRSLRHAPPQRVLFQPEMSRRETRQSTGHLNSPQPNGIYSTSGAAMTIANYEPRTNVPSTMKPVNTPSNNPDYFNSLKRKFIVNRKNRAVPLKGMMLPGTGFPGPNIYIRALHALRSKEPEEEAYALHHLVKISHERGDKYRFDQFPGLAEALIEKVIQVASLYYDVKWEISYVEEEFDQPDVLNGLSGTKNLLRRIRSLQTLDRQDDLLPDEEAKALNMINEAALILRNMVMLHENAYHASTIPFTRDLIVIILNLPNHPMVTELQHYALEIAEQITRFWFLDAQDPMYQSLLAQVNCDDRGKIITSLRALGRIAMNLEVANKLPGVPEKTIKSICDWLLVEDEELRIACLDFLYLYTGFVENVQTLVNEIDVEVLVNQLVRLLQFGAQAFEERRSSPKTSKSSSQADGAPKLSSAIIEQLISLDEPERSSQWLRTCFEEDPTGEITQIQLWSAYNAAFQELMMHNPSFKALMPAKDFITNVSTTFVGAQAQVITTTTPPKYTIKGIRPRSVPVDPSTKKQYMRCCWHPPSLLNGVSDTKHSTAKIECGEFTSGVKAMWEHIVSAHLKVPRDDSGKWLLEQKPDISMENGDAVSTTKPIKYFCHWGGCTHFNPSGTDSALEAGQHVKTHLPDTGLLHSIHAKHNRTPSNSTPLTSSAQVRHENFQPQFSQPVGLGSLGMGARYNDKYGHSDRPVPTAQMPAHQPAPNFRYYNTMTDESGDAAGLPLSSILVLRNLARQLGKLPPPSSIHEIPDSPTHKRTFSESSPDSRRTTGGKKPKLSDAARENRDRDIERDEKDQQEARAAGWVSRVFTPVKEQLGYVVAHNLTLRNYMGPLFKAIAEGGVKVISNHA
ncbi:Chromatin structure-remodeling complex protein rsc9 [Kalmusia sp. IMI 367209]|nr:Chromatin structure-remodeling complex protein rsc9 [Kalmusia sp. IMI 367209]